MNSTLPIGLEALLGASVEGARLEFKASWNADTTGPQVLKTLCAFANDLQNLNGGYVLIGVGEDNGVAVRPVAGLDEAEIDAAQKWIRGNCRRISPTYMPVFDTPTIDGRRILVLWAPASDARPHQAPDGPKGPPAYWVRIGSETIAAKDDLQTRLMQQTARVPFDDRRAFDATNDDLRISLAREFLRDVRSDLLQETDANRIYASMQIVQRTNGHTVPRNVGLLFFTDTPRRWFRGARIELVEFSDATGGDTQSEQIFEGPLHQQLRQCLAFLENMTTRHLEKQSNVPETKGWVSYPAPALREALVNALYHRSYEGEVEPTKVYLYPNRVEVISYPGPTGGIEPEHLRGERPLPPVPARNRRIGEFLKELRLAEGRGTGVPKIARSMRENGSPAPVFDFDAGRTYFRVVLPAHPEYVALTTLRDYAYRRATGDANGALRVLQDAWSSGQTSASVAATLVEAWAERSDFAAARRVVEAYPDHKSPAFGRVVAALANALVDAGRTDEAAEALNRLPELLSARDAIDAAIVERRVGRQDRAHRYFVSAGELVLQDARALHEFAQTKKRLALTLDARRPVAKATRQRLLGEAASHLERVVRMDAAPTRHAWAWFDLGEVRRAQARPQPEVVEALERAVALVPDELRFQTALERAKQSSD